MSPRPAASNPQQTQGPSIEAARYWLLPALAAAVVGLLLARSYWPGMPPLLRHALVGHWAMFCLTYIGIAAISLAPAPLGKAVDRLLDSHLQRWATGLYGLIALSFFLPLELRSALQTLSESDPGGSFFRDLLRDWVMGFSLQSLRNAIEAVIWPVALIRDHGWQGFLALYAACSLVFGAGKQLLPESARGEQKPSKD